MRKNIVPLIVVGIIVAGLAVFIVYQVINSKTYEELFIEALDQSCTGYSRAQGDMDGIETVTYARANPNMTIVVNKFKKEKDAENAYKTLTVTGIGIVPEGGATQNIGHNANVYLIHPQGKDLYYGCGKVGTKLVFGIRSDDENYFSTMFMSIKGNYSALCMKEGM